MAIRTIKVDITGLKEIEKAQKAVSTLRDSVLDFEKRLKKMGGKNTSSLSFNVNLKLNTDKALSDYLALKRQIENIPIKVGTKKGSTSDSNVPTVKKTKVSRPTGKSTDYVKVRDQDYQSWRNLHKVVQDVSNATVSLTNRMVSLGAVNPAKGLLSVFNKVNSTVLGIQNTLFGFVGNKLTGAIGNAVQGTLSAVTGGIGQLKDEANNLGDAMQIYRINMQALGFDEKETNKSIKRLGDYGKASVFDATDLLEQASTYTAYGRKDAESIVKGYAGLLAQTKNPVQGMKTVTTQTSQMLANGFLNQGDYRFIRERLSALGASKLNAELLKIAQSKGETSITDATRKKLITADEYLDAVNKLGNQDVFQNLVTSIVTPRQALANFKETLSNLLVFDEIDEEGNAKPGALNQVYVATREFIKGITEIVGTDKFKEYVTRLGNAIGGTIQQVNQFGASWKLAFGKQTLSAIEEFAKEFSRGVKDLNVAPLFFNITKEINNTLKSSGKAFGQFTKDFVMSVSSITSSLVNLLAQFVKGGGLDIFSNYLKVFDNLGKLAVKSDAMKDFVDVYKYLSDTLNTLVLSVKPSDIKNVTSSIRSLIVQVLNFVEKVATKTTLISDVSEVFSSIINTLSNIVNKLSKFNPQSVNKVLGYLKNTINGILKHIEPIIVELGKGAITALASSSGENFFKAVGNFVKAVTSAIKQFLTSIGGTVEGGFKKILDFLSATVNFASIVAKLLAPIGKYLVMGYIGTKFASWAGNIISSLMTVATAMSSVTNGRKNLLGLGTNFGNSALASQGVTSANVNTAYSGLSRVNANANKAGAMSRVARNKAIRNARIGAGALLGADLALGAVNSSVQNSTSASQGLKDFTDVLSSTASWASSGALIGSAFSPVGTLVGGGIGALIGLGSSLFGIANRDKESKKLEQEAKKQADETKKEEFIQQVAHLNEIAKENSNMQAQYFKSISKDDSLTNSVMKANTLIEAVKNNRGGTLETAVKELGIETAKVPNNVESLFVKIGDQVKSWKELKDESGLTDEQLLSSLQLAKSSIGEKYVELVNETGQEVVASIQNLTKGEEHRQTSNLDTFKGRLSQLGVTVQEGKELIFKDISSITDDITAVLKSTSYDTAEEKANAIQGVLEKFGLDTTEFAKLSVIDKIDKIKALMKESELLGGTSDEQFSKIKEDISIRIKGYNDTLGNVLDRVGNEQLADFQTVLKEAEALNNAGGEKADATKIIAFYDSVEKLVKEGYVKAEEATKLFELAGIKDVSVEEVGKGAYKFKKEVQEFIQTGTKKINEGSTGLKEVPITEARTRDLFEKARELASVVRQQIDSAISKLDEAIKQVTNSNDYDKQRVYSNYRRQLEGDRDVLGFYTGGIIPEYHSNGLPVGIDWRRRGTDTVPTMLTPGEYVLRKKAVDSLGTNLLNNLNKYGVGALQNVAKSTIINNVYNTNNAQINQNIDNKSQYLNGMFGVDKLMRYV